MTVKATDKDIGANAEVTYAKVQDTFLGNYSHQMLDYCH
jgi:hypothetical protein